MSEEDWWGDCTNTADEEAKQLHYAKFMGLEPVSGEGWFAPPIDLGGRSVLDIGGGPVSLLLKCRNRGRSAVLDPGNWPEWVSARYKAAGIEYIHQPAESAKLGDTFDEVWIYNCLQHVQNPAEVICTAQRYGRIIRICEWLDTERNELHPHILTASWLDAQLEAKGTVHEIDWDRYVPHIYGAVVQVLDNLKYEITNKQPDSDVTVIVLSCKRFDLLKRTISSLLDTINYPVRIIMLDDSEDTATHKDIVREYGHLFDIYIHGKSHGPAWAADKLLSMVETKYAFRCEDDWEFIQSGYLQASIEILEEQPEIGVIGIVLDDEFKKYGAVDTSTSYSTSSGQRYYDHPRWRIDENHAWWNGWIGSPNLKRMADIKKLGKYSNVKSEAEWDREVWAKSGMRSVWLEDQYAKHTGEGRSVWPDGENGRYWTRPSSGKENKEDSRHPETLGPTGNTFSCGWSGELSRTFRFHLLGLAHVPVHRDYSSCAYTQKILKLSKMLTDNGHEVILYAGEGSEAVCSELVECVSNEDRIRAYGDYDWRSEFFKHAPDDHAYKTFNENASREILKRRRERDFLLVTFGNYQLPIVNTVGIPMTVEAGIGYRGVFAKYKVFESYAWMHYLYGLLGQNDGSWYDCVIPNYFDPEDFPMGKHDGDYYLYMGRVIRRKGIQIAVQVTREIGARLIIAGQGTLKNEVEGLDIKGNHIEFVGSVGPEERARLMGGAIASFAPTIYLEPYGGVAVEAQMTGCPVITTDWGAFTETILPGITGYRCRTFNEFMHAATSVPSLDNNACRKWAIENYSMERVAEQYEGYFRSLYDLWEPKGWYLEHSNWSPERYEKTYPLSR